MKMNEFIKIKKIDSFNYKNRLNINSNDFISIISSKFKKRYLII